MKASSLLVKAPVKAVSVRGLLALSLLGLSSIGSAAVAASQCKGLDNTACVASADCGWVESYQRKDGRDVKAFCRTSSKGKSKKVANTKLNKTADKSDTKKSTKAS